MAVIMLSDVILPRVAGMPPYIDFLPDLGSPWVPCSKSRPRWPRQDRRRDRPGRRRAVRAGLARRGVGRAGAPRGRDPVFDFRVCTPRPGPGQGPLRLRPVRRARPRGRRRRRPGLPRAAPRLPEARRRRARGASAPPTTAARSSTRTARRLRARRRGPARRPRVHHPLALHRPDRGHVPRGQGQARRPLLPRRQRPHRRRLGGRHRRVAAPDARPLRRPGGRDGGPPDRRTPAPRRRPGPVHRAGRPRLRQRDVRAAAPVDHRPPRRGPRRRHPGPQVADVAAHLRAPVPRRDRCHPALVGDPAAGAARRGAARADRPLGGVDRLRGRLRQRRHPAPPLHPRPRRQPAAVPPYLLRHDVA